MLAASRVWHGRGCGIVGLPNIGKSTFFNAMTCSQIAKTGNYEFCTIDANLSKAKVHDHRLHALAKFAKSQSIVEAQIDVADVAGLIAGASKGAGMGNKFLADIRPVNIILHMVRCFESAKDGFGTPDPLGSISVIDSELILADLESAEKKMQKMRSRKAGDAELIFTKAAHAHLEAGQPARTMKLKKGEDAWLRDMQLMSGKPVLFVLNVDEDSMKDGNSYSKQVMDSVGAENCVQVCSVIEEQTAQMSRDDRLMFLEEYGVAQPQSEVLLERVRSMLELRTFFTVGPKMAHAWQFAAGTTVKQAAGEIHGDFEKQFVAARGLAWDSFVKHKNLGEAERAMKPLGPSVEMEDGLVYVVEHDAKR